MVNGGTPLPACWGCSATLPPPRIPPPPPPPPPPRRVLILHHMGGYYADLDVECLVPIDQWQQRYPWTASLQPSLVLGVESIPVCVHSA